MLRLYSYSTCEIYLDLQTDHNSDIIEVVMLIHSDEKTGGLKNKERTQRSVRYIDLTGIGDLS